jgi:hypothetical protein
MPDFMLEPEEIEPVRASRRVRMVATGVAPTADISPSRPGKEPDPCYVPCEACGVLVLLGATAGGTRLALDTHRRTYTVLWEKGAAQPRFQESRAYPVHRCGAHTGEL